MVDHIFFTTVALFASRAFAQPLSGPETSFRWNYPALEVVRTGEFSYYPPLTLPDFERYFYANGFAPFVSLQYEWSYFILGSTLPQLNGFVVTAQFAATLVLVYSIVAANSDRLAGLAAAAILASSWLVFWTFHFGQETGWIAFALVAALWCCRSSHLRLLPVAHLSLAFALLPALVAREYGPVFIGAGVLFALSSGARLCELALFVGISVALAAPWYMYVWLGCGNPFYTLSPLGLFPTNPVIDHLLAATHESRALLQHPGVLAHRALDLVLNSPLLVVAGCFALFAWRWHRAILLVAGLVVALWCSAVGYS